jgi:hypothetical protein
VRSSGLEQLKREADIIIVLEMTITADYITSEEMRETISFIAQSSRKFYLHMAEKIEA